MHRMTVIHPTKAVRAAVLAAAAMAVVLLAGALGRHGGGPAKLKTTEDRIAYLAALGWEADAESEELKEISLPAEFGQVLENYNELQRRQGFDLKKYAGKTVVSCTYRICNAPEEDVRCTLYLYKNALIGADLHSVSFTGYMQPLIKNQTSGQ